MYLVKQRPPTNLQYLITYSSIS